MWTVSHHCSSGVLVERVLGQLPIMVKCKNCKIPVEVVLSSQHICTTTIWSFSPLRATLIFMNFSISANIGFSFSILLFNFKKCCWDGFHPEASLKGPFPLTMKVNPGKKYWEVRMRIRLWVFVINACVPPSKGKPSLIDIQQCSALPHFQRQTEEV